MKNLKRTFYTLLMICGATVYAQDFDTYDMDRDGMLNQEEFMERNNDGYNNWDVNGDGNIDNTEFNDRVYQNFDRNRDNYLDENEWNDGMNTTAGQYLKTEDHGVFDADRDGRLISDEWRNGMKKNTWFNDYDTNHDGLLNSNEWNENSFNDWDANDDDFIDADEYSFNNDFDNWE